MWLSITHHAFTAQTRLHHPMLYPTLCIVNLDPPPSYTPNTQPGQPGQTQPPAYGFQPLPQPYMPSSVTVATHSGMQPMNTSTIIYSTTPMAPMTSPPSDYLVLSIITTIFCCFWIGIAAILKSNETRGRIARGKI